ncbi:MAG: cytochrome c oxidase assembly protein COX16 [Thermoproteota archaeon]|nr:cytochrome c oxidase assembly protein COX16 [Thermoproteota archaeon]
MVGHLLFKVTNKLALFFILAISVITVIDSNVINFYAYTNKELPVSSKIGIFTIFSITFAIFAIVLLKSIESYDFNSNYKRKKAQNLVRFTALTSQFMVIALLAVEIVQMAFVKMYNSNLTLLILFSSFVPSVLFILLLVVLLVRWFRSSKNFMIIAYAISFSIVCIYLVLSIVYVNVQYTSTSEWIKAKSLHSTLVNSSVSDLSFSFGVTLDALSLLSFVFVWIATVALLRQYRNKIGSTRFWLIITIPLMYFLFPFETYFANFSEAMLSGSPVIFSVIYIVLFSATKQVGGVLFSIVFLTAATKIKQPNLQNSLKMAAIGISVVFSSIEINSLLYAAYPPYGVLTIMLMPLGSYCLFIGLFASARLVSQDKKLRKEFFQSAEKQLGLLKTIGKVQMEKELEKSLKSILKRPSILEESKDDYRGEENVRELVQEVLDELRSKQSTIEKADK